MTALPADQFVKTVVDRGVSFFTGVPDSLLKDFYNALAESDLPLVNVTAANEGAALSLAAGHYAATGRPAMVYLQNSGLGNLVNPLLSLVDPTVYGIPVMLLVGWRGQPGTTDEPQHMRQGEVTLSLLETLGVPTWVLEADRESARHTIDAAVAAAVGRRGPVAIVVPPKSFACFSNGVAHDSSELTREEALGAVIANGDSRDIYVSTTGMLSRELFELRESRGEGHARDFLTVGSMGHAISIALGVALGQPHRRIVCLDGDGSLIMHMGSSAVAAQRGPVSLYHILFNNGVHDSVGAQPTIARGLNLTMLAESMGYRTAGPCARRSDMPATLESFFATPGPGFLEIVVRPGARPDLGRPTSTPAENLGSLMAELRRHRGDTES